MATLCTYSIYFSTSDLLSSIISNIDKHEFSSIWKWISCCNDVMNHVECVIKRDPLPDDKILDWPNLKQIAEDILTFCRKCIRVLKISVVYRFCSRSICGISRKNKS